ncbi:hypothetical protein EQU50_07485 [Candidatus Finniella inopinata]|uniref:Protein-L-isoaspartate O-methyltransferase n=2 Tax=Candidatus Finniella inopinata TaxID=1696036 RepID=A0A4Q7DF42_9PROT|nr:hypothetical protein EQU50_07485 [Candidatus Finniella inopinata]
MIWGQLRPHIILPKPLKHAFAKVPRPLFVPPSHQECCYHDDHIPLTEKGPHQRFLLSPLLLSKLLVHADLEMIAHKKVLILSGGTGYSAALFGQMEADCLMVETNNDLADQARENLQSYTRVIVESSPSHLINELLDEQLFDIIFIDGGAVQTIPQFLIVRLRPSGFLLALQSKHPSTTNELCLCYGMLVPHTGPASILFDAWAPLNQEFTDKPSFCF